MKSTPNKEQKMNQRIEQIYTELKLADRMTPGRTPWQTLRKRAEEAALVEDAVRERDPERFALIQRYGQFCPCGIDLHRNGCYRCLKAAGAVWTCDPADEARWHGTANPYLPLMDANSDNPLEASIARLRAEA